MMAKREPIKKTATHHSEVDLAEAAMEELKTDLQRVQADFANFKRRIEGERGELMAAAKVSVVGELLPLFDNLDRAISHIPSELADDAWAQGVEQVSKQVGETLANLGVSVYGRVGDDFDPNLHEAIDHDGAGHHLTEVVQKGYRVDNRVIRPAMVKVGRVNSNHKEDK